MRIEDVIGQRLLEGRKELEMTQAQIGEELGRYLGKPWPRQAVSAAENGDRAFTAPEIVAFAMVLGCTIETLLEPPAGVDEVTLGDGPPLDSRHFRAAAATNSDLADLAAAMTELRHAFPELQTHVGHTRDLMEATYRKLWTAVRGRGIDVAEDEVAEIRRRNAEKQERRRRALKKHNQGPDQHDDEPQP